MAELLETKVVGNAPDLQYMFPGQTFLSGWGSPESFSRHIRAMDKSKSWCDSGWEPDNSFYGTKTMEEALDMADNGWKEGTELIEKLRNKILAISPIRKRPVEYDIVGTVPCIPRAVAGNPLNMRKPKDARSRKRTVITLVSNMSVNCGVSADVISNRAATIAVLVDHIEAAGFACEIITIAPTSNSKVKVLTAVTVKQSHHPVDLAKLSFSLGHAGMFRRLVFADWGGDKHNEKLGHGLGHAHNLDFKEKFAEKGMYYLQSAEGTVGQNFKTPELAATAGMAFLIKELQEQDCPAFPKLLNKELTKSTDQSIIIPDLEDDDADF